MDRERCSSLLQRALSHGETSLHERIAETAESHARRSRDGFVFGSPPAVRVNCLFMPAEHAGQEKAPNAARTGPGALALIFAYYRCAPLSAALPCPGGVTPCCVRTRSRGSKLQCPGQQVARAPLSFDEIMLANERISFFELLLALLTLEPPLGATVRAIAARHGAMLALPAYVLGEPRDVAEI